FLVSAGSLGGSPAYWGGAAGLVLYYALYEYLHWCMHIPQNRRLEDTEAFRFLKAHHYLHHRYAFRNLNVVMPLADWLLGTLVLPSPTDLTAPELISIKASPRLATAIPEPQACEGRNEEKGKGEGKQLKPFPAEAEPHY